MQAVAFVGCLTVLLLGALPPEAKAVKASPPTVTCSAAKCEVCVSEDGRCVQCEKDYDCFANKEKSDQEKTVNQQQQNADEAKAAQDASAQKRGETKDKIKQFLDLMREGNRSR